MHSQLSPIVVGDDYDNTDDDDDDGRPTSFLVDKVHKRQPVWSVREDVRLAFERVADRAHVV